MADPSEPVVDLVDEARVVAALPILDGIARRLAHRIGANVDDLRSIGHFALTDILRRYDPNGLPFETYLRQRLRWAIIDGVRRETHGGRTYLRAGAIRASANLSAARSRPDEARMPPSSASHMSHLASGLREHALVMGIKLIVSGEGETTAVTASSTSPERLTQRRALVEALREAVVTLEDPRQRIIVERYYFKGEPLPLIARDLGITKGWASRLHAAAVTVLARRLRGVVSSR
jgi:RNA polymerase sigma factor FliA